MNRSLGARGSAVSVLRLGCNNIGGRLEVTRQPANFSEIIFLNFLNRIAKCQCQLFFVTIKALSRKWN